MTATGLSRGTTFAFALATGAAAANMNCLQPILAVIATDLQASPATVGLIAVALQVGYALGVLAFVPLGDIVERRGLILGLFAISTLCLAAAALAPTIALLILAFGAVGIASTAAQVVLPLAADLANPSLRGRTLGVLNMGFVYGTVLVRVVGGVLGKVVSWRAVFALAAVFSALSTLALARSTPPFLPAAKMRYRELYSSMPVFIRDYPSLRAAVVLGFCVFALFTGVWSSLAFHMRDLGYGSDVVGYLGAVSLFGAFFASRVGLYTDRWGTPAVGGICWTAMLAGLAILFFAGSNLVVLIVGLCLFGAGSQGLTLTNIIHVLGIDPAARSRLNTIFNVALYGGGAYGAFLCVWAFQLAGWNAVCAVYLFHMVIMGVALLWMRRVIRTRPA
jgi:predicted MFS family arabinose efflux permease